jgi:hypothetical protein
MTVTMRNMVATRCLRLGTLLVEFNSPGMG